MGSLIGLVLGLGLALVLWSGRSARPQPARTTRWAVDRRAGQLVAWTVGCATVTFACALGVSKSVVVAGAFAVLAGYAPLALRRQRVDRRQAAHRQAWPDVVDDLTSAVRAGLSLPEALTQLGSRGPAPLQPAFGRFGERYQATGVLGPALDQLKDDLADPVADRVIEALRLARDVGGSDLGRLLRTLSVFLREDARTRGELESRQAWAVNGARLAVAAPWLVLGLLSLHPEAVRAYDSSAGLVIVVFGAMVSVGAYRLMMRIGRLPVEQRVFR